MKEKCLCCGYKTLPKKVEECICFICPVCFWENDIFMKNIYDTKEKSDSNGGMTLDEARDNYKNYGACDKKFIDKVRKPNKDEIE